MTQDTTKLNKLFAYLAGYFRISIDDVAAMWANGELEDVLKDLRNAGLI